MWQILWRGVFLPPLPSMSSTEKVHPELGNRTDENKTFYKRQRNYHDSLLRKSKNNYFSNLKEKGIVYNNFFWETAKPSLFDKVIIRDKMNLSENG